MEKSHDFYIDFIMLNLILNHFTNSCKLVAEVY